MWRHTSVRGRRPAAARQGVPWLEFDGSGPAAIAEAAQRSIAAELRVRADQLEIETPEDLFCN
jgi:hypothetical protein